MISMTTDSSCRKISEHHGVLMSVPTEHNTVQARTLAYAQEIGWRYVPRAEAEVRRGFDPDAVTPEERARKASLFFGGRAAS